MLFATIDSINKEGCSEVVNTLRRNLLETLLHEIPRSKSRITTELGGAFNVISKNAIEASYALSGDLNGPETNLL